VADVGAVGLAAGEAAVLLRAVGGVTLDFVRSGIFGRRVGRPHRITHRDGD
jgi:hypothetical protein